MLNRLACALEMQTLHYIAFIYVFTRAKCYAGVYVTYRGSIRQWVVCVLYSRSTCAGGRLRERLCEFFSWLACAIGAAASGRKRSLH